MFKKFAALAAAAALSLGVMTGCGVSGTTADSTGYSARTAGADSGPRPVRDHTVHIRHDPVADEVAERRMAASRSRSSPTASSAAKTRTLSSCRPALSP